MITSCLFIKNRTFSASALNANFAESDNLKAKPKNKEHRVLPNVASFIEENTFSIELFEKEFLELCRITSKFSSPSPISSYMNFQVCIVACLLLEVVARLKRVVDGKKVTVVLGQPNEKEQYSLCDEFEMEERRIKKEEHKLFLTYGYDSTRKLSASKRIGLMLRCISIVAQTSASQVKKPVIHYERIAEVISRTKSFKLVLEEYKLRFSLLQQSIKHIFEGKQLRKVNSNDCSRIDLVLEKFEYLITTLPSLKKYFEGDCSFLQERGNVTLAQCLMVEFINSFYFD